MSASSFINIVSNNFESLKHNFQIGLKAHGYEFDEDLFIDTLLRCSCTLKDHIMTEKEAAKYYWVAYVNGLKKLKSKPTEFDIDDYDIDLLEESYNEDLDQLYDYIMKSISSKFGEKIMTAWKLHICSGLTYKELKAQGFDIKFNYEFKRITRFIRNHLVKNKMFIELLSNIRDDERIYI